MHAPAFFRQNKHAFPASATDTPFQLAKNTSLDYFAWLAESPALATDFQAWMTVKQQASPNWVDWFDVRGLILDGFRGRSGGGCSVACPERGHGPGYGDGDGDGDGDGESEVLIVDIGGGQGAYLHAFGKFPETPGRRILQDLPHVLETMTNVPDRTELMAQSIVNSGSVLTAKAAKLADTFGDDFDEVRAIPATLNPA
jgi:hypothetical protein